MHIIPENEMQNYKNSGFYELIDARENSYNILPGTFMQEGTGNYAVIASDTDKMLAHIREQFTYIEAAGGLVYNDKNELLIIFRRGKYDLPKGKCEPDEHVEVTAVREVMEECGIKEVKLLSLVDHTYHIYPLKNKTVFKKTFWFSMKAPDQVPVPQTEEDIEYTAWLPLNRLDRFTANTYPTLIEVLKSAGHL